MKRILLILILGAIAPVYLQAGTGAPAAASAAASATAQAPVATSAADVKNSAAAAAQQQNGAQVPDDIIRAEWTAYSERPKLNETHCQRIIDWIKEDPQNRKNARCQRSGYHIFEAVYFLRFEKNIAALQPALDFLLSLKPETYSATAPKDKSFGHVVESSSFSLLNGTLAPSNTKGQNDFYRFAMKIARLMFLNGRNLLQIKEDAAYIKEKYEAMSRAFGGDLYHQSQINAFQTAIDEVDTIHQEALERVGLATSEPFNQALLPDLQRIVSGYTTELTLDEAQRAIRELSASQPPAQ